MLLNMTSHLTQGWGFLAPNLSPFPAYATDPEKYRSFVDIYKCVFPIVLVCFQWCNYRVRYTMRPGTKIFLHPTNTICRVWNGF